MSVHWTVGYKEGGTQKKSQHRTIKHSRAFCHCPDGKCESGFQTSPKKNLKPKNTLAERLSWFASGKPKSNYKKPGSNKK